MSPSARVYATTGAGDEMAMDEEGRGKLLEDLAAAPRQLRALTESIRADVLDGPSTPKEWSARDVLAHLLASSHVWGGMIGRMLDEDRPAIRYVSPRTWLKTKDLYERSFEDIFDEFQAVRVALLARLDALSLDAWERDGTFTGGSRTGVPTVAAYARNIVEHERIHLAQVAEIVAKSMA